MYLSWIELMFSLAAPLQAGSLVPMYVGRNLGGPFAWPLGGAAVGIHGFQPDSIVKVEVHNQQSRGHSSERAGHKLVLLNLIAHS